jgi:pimeloyl-ACP methyl ester carboxylesterase
MSSTADLPTTSSASNELRLFPTGTRLRESTLSSGLRVRWYELGDADKPAVLFVHGFPELAVSWAQQFHGLQSQFRLIAADQRGYGGSDAPRAFWKYTMRHAARDAVELLAEAGVESAHLVGHDMGAAVVWDAAQRFPKSFRSLAIVNGPCLPLMYRNALKQAGPSSYVWRMLVPFWFSEKSRRDPEFMLRDAFHRDEDHKRVFSDEVIAAYAKHIRRRGVPAVNYYRANALFPTFRLRKVDVPVRLVWGEHDPWVGDFFRDPATYHGFAREVDAVLVPGMGHFVQQQAAEQVNAALREHWLTVEARIEAALKADSGS